jgi:type III secretory pathway component EscT
MKQPKVNPYSNDLILLEQKRFTKGIKIGILITIPLWGIVFYGVDYFFAFA